MNHGGFDDAVRIDASGDVFDSVDGVDYQVGDCIAGRIRVPVFFNPAPFSNIRRGDAGIFVGRCWGCGA